MKIQTLSDLTVALSKLGIRVNVGEDDDGQVVLYTGLAVDKDDNLVELPTSEDADDDDER